MPTIGNKIKYSFSGNGHEGYFKGIEGPGYSVASIDITTADDVGTNQGGDQGQDWSGVIFRKKYPGTIEPGQVNLSIAFDGTKKWPIIGQPETLVLTWPTTPLTPNVGPSVSLDGHVGEFNITGGGDLDNMLEGNIVFECSGQPVLTDGS